MNKTKKKGVGGIFFISIVALSCFCMITLTSLSRSSTIVSISDNIALLVSTKVSVASYNINSDSYEVYGNPAIRRIDGSYYYPLQDFIEISKEYGFLKIEPKEVKVTWDKNKRTATVDIGPFECTWGEVMRPRKQTTIIEW